MKNIRRGADLHGPRLSTIFPEFSKKNPDEVNAHRDSAGSGTTIIITEIEKLSRGVGPKSFAITTPGLALGDAGLTPVGSSQTSYSPTLLNHPCLVPAKRGDSTREQWVD